jgi:hypothetical protein
MGVRRFAAGRCFLESLGSTSVKRTFVAFREHTPLPLRSRPMESFHSAHSPLASCIRPWPILCFVLLALRPTISIGETWEVGPSRKFERIEQANEVAQPGDVILVYPRLDGTPYERTAVFVSQRDLTFRAMPAEGNDCVPISGAGFEYSGRGQIPRAIFQFNRGSDGCVLEGFELHEAHNATHNGAGVRINQANNITIRRCNIHDNDMGIMSNGDGTLEAGRNQVVEACRVHHNGSLEDPGYNHNFYLGGTSVTIRFCDVASSLTGHNVKSRAHFTRVEYSFIHDSANREFDLVDAADTARPESDAVILGCIIAKDPQCRGNRGVIHFGQDGGGKHAGTLFLVHNSIVHPFVSPLLELSTDAARAVFVGNVVSDGGANQYNQKIVGAHGGASPSRLTGNSNWFSGGFTLADGVGLDPATNSFQRLHPVFVDPVQHDFRLAGAIADQAIAPYRAADLDLPRGPGAVPPEAEPPLRWQYGHSASAQPRRDGQRLTLGAIETTP